MKLEFRAIEVAESYVSLTLVITSATRTEKLAGSLGFTMQEFVEFRDGLLQLPKKAGIQAVFSSGLLDLGK